MPSKTVLTALWLVGTVVAAAVAWQSLRFVSASTEGDLAATDGADVTVVDPEASLTPSSTVPSSSTSSSTEPLSGAGSGETTVPPTDSVADGTAGAITGSSADQPATQSQISERTFDLIGGRTAIRFSPDEVVVVWATPAPGYSVESHDEDDGVEVEFSNGIHESKIEAWWADGPRFETREQND